MDLKHRVIISYYSRLINSSANIPMEMRSKEDPSKQTKAVEKLIKETIIGRLPEYKGKVFSVGGHVRDLLMGSNPKDLDIVVDDPELKMKSAEEFSKRLVEVLNIKTENNPHPLNTEYGIWSVILFNPKDSEGHREPFIYDGVDISGYVIEITPPRKEGPYDLDDRKPSYVEYTSKEEDAKRRDLTINSLYMDLTTGEIQDYIGGVEDLKSKTLRPPDHPDGTIQVYKDDPLRIFRLIRFKGRYPEFSIDPKTKEIIKDFVNSDDGKKIIDTKLSHERIRDELEEILTNPDGNIAAEGLERIRKFGLLDKISKSLSKLIDIYHDTVFHRGESVWEHTLDVVSKSAPTLEARLSALFHDVGKLETMSKATDSQGRDRIRFIGHEKEGLKLAEQALKELKFPNNVINVVKKIIHSHMGFREYGSLKKKRELKLIRIYIEKLYDNLEDAISVLKADSKGSLEEERRVNNLERDILKQKDSDILLGLLKETSKGYEYASPLSGKEIMDYINEKGEIIGALKTKLKEMLIEGKISGSSEKEVHDKALEVLDIILKDKNRLSSILRKYKKSTDEFFQVK